MSIILILRDPGFLAPILISNSERSYCQEFNEDLLITRSFFHYRYKGQAGHELGEEEIFIWEEREGQ